MGIAHSYGLTDAKIISPDEVLKLSPFKDLKFDPGYFIVKSFASSNPFNFLFKYLAFVPSVIIGLF